MSNMAKPATSIAGRAYVLGDNIDTDQIIPAQYLNLVPTIPEEYRKLGSYALAGLPDGYPPFVAPGRETSPYTILIAGRNFGCGSSREHAPIALGAAGALAVVAESYARIFFRNAVATGEVYPLECEERLCALFHTGDEARIDLPASRITNVASGRSFALRPLGAVAPVVEAGGIFGYARSTGMIRS
jgi:3-isopropylmalate/(R)-2-methylmalate dehydratase small subunit